MTWIFVGKDYDGFGSRRCETRLGRGVASTALSALALGTVINTETGPTTPSGDALVDPRQSLPCFDPSYPNTIDPGQGWNVLGESHLNNTY